MDFFNDIFHNLALLEFYFSNIIYILLYIDFILSIFFQHSNILTRASHHWCLASNIVLVQKFVVHVNNKVHINALHNWLVARDIQQWHHQLCCCCAHGPLVRYVNLLVAYPNMHRGTCVAHVPWCMSGSLTGGFLWSWKMRKRSRNSRRMSNSQFYVSGKKPVLWCHHDIHWPKRTNKMLTSYCYVTSYLITPMDAMTVTLLRQWIRSKEYDIWCRAIWFVVPVSQ